MNKYFIYILSAVFVFLFSVGNALAENIFCPEGVANDVTEYSCRKLKQTSVYAVPEDSENYDNEWDNSDEHKNENYVTHLLYPSPPYSAKPDQEIRNGLPTNDGCPYDDCESNNKIPLIIIHGWQGANGLTDPSELIKFENSAEKYWENFTNFFYVSSLAAYYQIYFYNYPSYKHITYNARILDTLISEIGAIQNRDDIVILAHSMGGLVARSLIEEHINDNTTYNIKSLITLATPHHGSPGSMKHWKDLGLIAEFFVKDLSTPGANDLFWDNYDGVFEWAQEDLLSCLDIYIPKPDDSECVNCPQPRLVANRDFDIYYRQQCISESCLKDSEGNDVSNMIGEMYSTSCNGQLEDEYVYRYSNPWLTKLNENYRLKIKSGGTLLPQYIFYAGQNEVHGKAPDGNNHFPDEFVFGELTDYIWDAGYVNDYIVPVTSALLDLKKHDLFIPKGTTNNELFEEIYGYSKSFLYRDQFIYPEEVYIYSWPNETPYENSGSSIRLFKDYHHTRMKDDAVGTECRPEGTWSDYLKACPYLAFFSVSHPLFNTLEGDLLYIAGFFPEDAEHTFSAFFNYTSRQSSASLTSLEHTLSPISQVLSDQDILRFDTQLSSSTFNTVHEGWGFNGFTNSTVNEKGWLALIPSADPQIVSPDYDINPADIDYIQFYGRNNSGNSEGKIYIKTDRNGGYRFFEMIDFTFTNDNRWHLVQINVHDIPGWDAAEKVLGIRIDPVENGNGSTDEIYIDYIRLRKIPPNLADPLVKWHPDGALLTSLTDSTVYLLERGYKRPFPNATVFEAHNFDWLNVISVSDAELDCYPPGDTVSIPTSWRLIQSLDDSGSSSEKIYLITEQNRRRWILNGDILTELGFSFSDVESVARAEFDSYLEGPKIASIYPEGTIIKDPYSPSVFTISNGESIPFTSQTIFESLGYYASDDDGDGLWDSIMEAQEKPDNIASKLIASDEIFQCQPPVEINVTIDWPKGGETLQGGTNREILYSFDNPDNISQVAITATYDKYQTVEVLTLSAPVSGGYVWNIPNAATNGAEASIEITAYDFAGRSFTGTQESCLTIESSDVANQDYFEIYNDGGDFLTIQDIYLETGELWINTPSIPVQPIAPNSHVRINVTINDTSSLPAGDHSETIHVISDDQLNPNRSITVHLKVKNDAVAPTEPLNLSVMPDSWAQTSVYSIDWGNPYDLSGIIGGYYKIGSGPTHDTDGHYFDISHKPLQLSVYSDGNYPVWLWLKDGDSNVDYHNSSVISLQHDTTTPIIHQNNPVNNSSGVPIDIPITFSTSDDFSGVDIGQIVMKINGIDVIPQQIAESEGIVQVEYQPNSAFDFNELVSVFLSVNDQSDPVNVIEKNFSFRTFSASGDADVDGLSNSDEYLYGTNPFVADTDTDRLPDGWEIANGLNPKISTGVDGPSGDFNSNGLTNVQEYLDGLYYSADDASITGAPSGTVSFNTATISVNGNGVVAYQYRIDGGVWQTEQLITEQIFLSELSDGVHIIEVIGRDINDYWQGSTSATTASWTVNNTSGVTFDDFEDGIIETSMWIASGNSVYERNGVLDIQTEVTDGGGSINSTWFNFDPTKPLQIERDIFLHYGNNYFIGRLHIEIDGAAEFKFGVNYANMAYASSPWEARYGIYLFRNNATGHKNTTTVNQSNSIDGIWNQWFHEKLIYDPTIGVVNYYINNELKITYSVGLLPDLPNYKMKIFTSPWGWYTGHYQLMDNFQLGFSAVPLKGDINGDGAVTITDVIVGLQVLVNNIQIELVISADVNGDGKIGVEEIIYAMQKQMD